MNALREHFVTLNGHKCRIWEKGQGEPLGFLAGYGGLSRWSEFLDELAKTRHLIAPSLPGFPGATGHDELDSHLDWIVATGELLNAAGLAGADLVGVSIGAALAAEVGAMWPNSLRSLTLVGPLGLCDPARPVADLWAQRPGQIANLLCAEPARFARHVAPPQGADPAEWAIMQIRASEAGARLLWPLGDTRLERRLRRIICPTLLVWGAADQVVPPDYATAFSSSLGGKSEICLIPGAGHLADLDAPEYLARHVIDFCQRAAKPH